jgi:hypothetical protein
LEAEDLQTSPGIVETQVIPVLAGNVVTVRKPLAKDTVYVYRVKDASSRHH